VGWRRNERKTKNKEKEEREKRVRNEMKSHHTAVHRDGPRTVRGSWETTSTSKFAVRRRGKAKREEGSWWLMESMKRGGRGCGGLLKLDVETVG